MGTQDGNGDSVKIRWSNNDGGENWASYNGYVGDRYRFHIVGERFGSKVDGFYLSDSETKKEYPRSELLRDAKKIAQYVVDAELSR